MAHRILVIDDEESLLFTIGEYFAIYGYLVECGRDMAEAMALLANGPYSAVIADLRLTGVDGVEGLEIVREVRQRYPNTRVILLTAYGSPETEAEARRLGVDAFLHKPQSLPAVAQLVHDLLQSPAPPQSSVRIQ